MHSRASDYPVLVTETTDPPSEDPAGADRPEARSAVDEPATQTGPATRETPDTPEGPEPDGKKRSLLRESVVLVSIALVLYYLTLTFVARPYLIPSESMEPTLHGCRGCVGDRIVVDKVSYRFHPPRAGDVVVFRGPPSWNVGYRSIRSHNTAVRWVQNALSFVALVPPDENDLVKRIIAVGGQTVQCRSDTGLTVDGEPLREPYLNPATMRADPAVYPCLGSSGGNVEFGPVVVPGGRLWMMGDNRTHSADSRAHCDNVGTEMQRGLWCTGDDSDAGTVPVGNVIGKARFIAWPPGRWGLVDSVNPQQGR